MISQTPVFYLRCRHTTLSAAHLANHKSEIRNYMVMWRTSDRQQSSSLHLAWPYESERVEDKLKRMKCCASMLFCELYLSTDSCVCFSHCLVRKHKYYHVVSMFPLVYVYRYIHFMSCKVYNAFTYITYFVMVQYRVVI